MFPFLFISDIIKRPTFQKKQVITLKKQLRGKLYKLDEKDKWQAVVHTGYNPEKKRHDKVRRTFYGTRRQAEAFLRDLIFELENPDVVVSQMPVGEWLDYWLENYGTIKYKWEKNTYERAERVVRVNIKPYISEIPLNALEPRHIMDLYSYLSTSGKIRRFKDEDGQTQTERIGLSSRTVRYVHTILNQALNEAVKLRKINENPAKGLTPAKEKTRNRDEWVVLDANQLYKFLEACKGHRDYAIIFTAAYTGARQSELLGLTWDKINWIEMTITINQALHLDYESEDGFEHRPRTKNETSTRIIDISERVLNVLQEYKNSQKEKGVYTELVFTEPDGTPINRHNLTHRFSNLAKNLGYPKMTFHHLRHTHATILLSDGAYINEVANRLGHADPKITFSIYGHVLPNRKQTLANRFDELIN